MLSTKGTVLVATIYIGETMRNVEVRIHEHTNPCNDSEPARHQRENPSHSFSWRIHCTAHSFHKRRIIEGLMIQQWSPTLNKQVHSYVAKLFPSESLKTYKKYAHSGRSFYPEDDSISRKRLVFLFKTFFSLVNSV